MIINFVSLQLQAHD